MRIAMRQRGRKGEQGGQTPGWLSAVWSEARMELYFQRRSPTFWVLVTLLAVLCVRFDRVPGTRARHAPAMVL